MRKYLHINLDDQSTETEELNGAACIRVGRHFIAKTLLDKGAAKVDPLSPGNPLIFSAGPLAGTNFSNANRISVGCKSPLTGGIKEANAGGTFAFALGQCEISGITLMGAASDWVIIRVTKDGKISFDDATPFLGMGNIETAALLFEKYGDKISMGLCSPVGEYGGLVMGSKKVKAIVVDMNKMPTFHDRKKVMGGVREYGKLLREDKAIEAFSMYGTAMVSDLTNQLGGLPTRNFSDGRLVDASEETLKLGGSYIRDLTIERGGEPTHACMPGCMIKCSNVYVDDKGEEMVSPLEYESLGLLGSNCGLKDPDDVARTNHQCNDLGIDTIEVGAMLGVLMEAGEGEFGDADFMLAAMDDIRAGNERGRILAQGAGLVGKHYDVARVPVIKNQGISAYDPRAIEVTGISMMMTAQGADHTTGNIPGHKSADMTTEELTEASLDIQEDCAAADSLGLCLFGRSVTNVNQDLIVGALNDAHGTNFDASFMKDLGREALEMEWEFNRQAGFTEDDDELPSFFYDESLEPTGKTARHHSGQGNQHMRKLLAAE